MREVPGSIPGQTLLFFAIFVGFNIGEDEIFFGVVDR